MNDLLRGTGAPVVYVLSAVAFVLGIKSLTKVRTSDRARPLIGVALMLAIVGAVFETGAPGLSSWGFVGCLAMGGTVGVLFARRREASVPAVAVAWVGGCAGAAVAVTAFQALGGEAEMRSIATTLVVSAGVLGVASFLLGIALAFVQSAGSVSLALATLAVALAGWSVALLGLGLGNAIMIVAGGVSGMVGMAIGRLVAVASGRGLFALWTGGAPPAGTDAAYANARSCGAEEAGMVLCDAGHVVFVPGFGMAASHAHHALKELASALQRRGARVTFALHPLAGCMPGHMNALLDEANVPHDRLVPMELAQAALQEADAVVVVGASDVVNSAAAADPRSPVFGMGAPDLRMARTVFVIKRSLRPGGSGVRNALFEQPNATMIFGDAKRVLQTLVAEVKGAAH